MFDALLEERDHDRVARPVVRELPFGSKVDEPHRAHVPQLGVDGNRCGLDRVARAVLSDGSGGDREGEDENDYAGRRMEHRHRSAGWGTVQRGGGPTSSRVPRFGGSVKIPTRAG